MTRFLFGDDFRQPASARRSPHSARAAEEELRQEVLAQAAYERGRLAGRAEAEAETARLRAAALERIAAETLRATDALDARAAAIEDEALDFFVALARTLAGRAMAGEPLAAITEAAREAFRHLRGVPHLVARVHATLVEDADSALRAMAREHGFEGRIVVIGSEDIPPGDARLEWADGAVVASRRARDDAVAALLARAGLDRSTGDRS